MPDLRHGSFQVAAFSLKVEIEWRTEPDALGHPECLLQKALVERLELRQAFAKARHGVWRKAFGNEQRDRSGGHDRARHLPARHHQAKQVDLLGIERHAQRRDRIQRKHPSKRQILQPVQGVPGMNGSLAPKARKIGALICVRRR
jgi:hypothetical protein